jgi:hypothetical protein
MGRSVFQFKLNQKMNKYKEYWGEFKNEDDLKEEMDEEGVDYNEEEEDFFDIDKSRRDRIREREKDELGRLRKR